LKERKNRADGALAQYQGVPDEFNKLVETYGKVGRGIDKLKIELERMEN
jgi:hypothetical protein